MLTLIFKINLYLSQLIKYRKMLESNLSINIGLYNIYYYNFAKFLKPKALTVVNELVFAKFGQTRHQNKNAIRREHSPDLVGPSCQIW